MRTRACAILLGALLGAGAHAGGMYKWVDDDGVTHFSQSPPPSRRGADEKLDGRESFSSSRNPAAAPTVRYEGEVRVYGGWENCTSELCRQVRQFDPECATPYCSQAKRYSRKCVSVVCQAEKLTFEREVEARLARQP